MRNFLLGFERSFVFSMVLFCLFAPVGAPAQEDSLLDEYQEARDLLAEKKYDQARDNLEKIFERADSESLIRRAHYQFGRSLFEQERQPVEALKHFDRVLDLGGPDNLTDDVLYFTAEVLASTLSQSKMALPYLKTVVEHFEGGDYHGDASKRLSALADDTSTITVYDPDRIPPPRIQLNFEKVDLKDFISAYSKMTKKNFIYRPNVSGQVTIYAPQGFPIYDLFDVFLNVLETRNYTAVREDGHYLVKSMKDAFRDGVDGSGDQSGLLTKMFPLEGLNWSNAKKTLNTILPRRNNLFLFQELNQVLVTTSPSRMESVAEMFEKLKSIDKPATVTFQPRHVPVSRLSNRLNSYLPQFIDKNSYKIIQLKTNNTLLVTLPRGKKDFLESKLPQFDGDMVDRLNMNVINLEHADARQIANKMKQLSSVLPGDFQKRNVEIVPSQRQNAVVISSTSSRALEILEEAVKNLDKPSPSQPKEVRVFPLEQTDEKTMANQLKNLSNLLPGDFPDKNVQIVPAKQQQALIVSAENKKVFPTIEKIIERLDEKNEDAPETIRLYKLNHANEQDIVDKLRKLTENLPGNFSKEELTILPDERQQAVVISARSTKILSIMERAVAELDREAMTDSSNFHVYKIHNAKAGPLAEKLNFLVEDNTGDPIKITADEQSNSLVISAGPDQFESMKPIIDQLDRSNSQILVDAYIVESSRDNARQLGIEWGESGEVNDREISGGTNFGLRPRFQEGSLLGLSAGVFDEAGDELVGVLSAFSEKSGFKIVSTSHLVANENEEASLSVGSVVPILEDSQVTSEGSINRSFTFENVGVDLAMTPTLSGDSEVTLDINQEIQELESTSEELGAPTRRTREINTRLSITDNKTLVLGGVLSSQSNRSRQSVPYLGEVPGLNYLFSNLDNQKERRNLLIFIQPHILRDENDASRVTEQLRERQQKRIDSDTSVSLDDLENLIDSTSSDTVQIDNSPDTETLSSTEYRRLREQYKEDASDTNGEDFGKDDPVDTSLRTSHRGPSESPKFSVYAFREAHRV